MCQVHVLLWEFSPVPTELRREWAKVAERGMLIPLDLALAYFVPTPREPQAECDTAIIVRSKAD